MQLVDYLWNSYHFFSAFTGEQRSSHSAEKCLDGRKDQYKNGRWRREYAKAGLSLVQEAVVLNRAQVLAFWKVCSR